MTKDELVILVDENNQEIGYERKLEVHRKGLRHRAVSGFVFSRDGRLLIQRRAFSKYHCGGLWANSCCSHPRPGEDPRNCMERRLHEELGLRLSMVYFGDFSYRADLDGGMIENEYVHGFVGVGEYVLDLNPEEVQDVDWVAMETLPALPEQQLAPWFKKYINQGFVKAASKALGNPDVAAG